MNPGIPRTIKFRTFSTIVASVMIAFGLTGTSMAQWLNFKAPGIPRTKDGKPDLSAPAPKMADGKPMNPQQDNAASRTLPLGTTAKVTNLETGKSAFDTIQERGPYVKGRIVDLSPSTAQEIGITRRQGVARVEVAPLAVPMPNGGVKLGAAADASLARDSLARGAMWARGRILARNDAINGAKL